MTTTAADRDFLTFASRRHDLLRGVAVLLEGDPVRADRLASSVVARRSGREVAETAALVAALAETVRPSPQLFDPPWAGAGRVQLVDTAPAAGHPLLAELQRLPRDPRAALVLGQYARLSAVEAAAVLGSDPTSVQRWADQAAASLARSRPDRLRPGVLAAELLGAASAALVGLTPTDPATDLIRARSLRQARLRRTALTVAAALLAAVLLGLGVVRGLPTERADDPPAPPISPVTVGPQPSATPTPGVLVSALCDVREPTCQATVMREWRTRMARVVAEHLDPQGGYFTEYSFSYDDRYEDKDFWAGRGGALGLDVFRLSGGGTDIYLQVASSYADAVRCGTTTDNRCQGVRFMDGNRFTFTASSDLRHGLEVQHRPDGTQVVTVIATARGTGQVLELGTGDLIDLVQDPRLRLPVI